MSANVIDPVPRTHLDADRAAALLDGIRHGRRGAVDELIRLCEPFVRGQARRYAWTRDQVDDVAQEVWVRLLRKASAIDEPAALFAWLQVVTRRVASVLGHRAARLVPSETVDDVRAACCTEEDALTSWERADVRRRVGDALARMTDVDRELLLLLHHDSRPGYERISQQVGRPVGSLGPTRQRLLRRLEREAEIAHLRSEREAA